MRKQHQDTVLSTSLLRLTAYQGLCSFTPAIRLCAAMVSSLPLESTKIVNSAVEDKEIPRIGQKNLSKSLLRTCQDANYARKIVDILLLSVPMKLTIIFRACHNQCLSTWFTTINKRTKSTIRRKENRKSIQKCIQRGSLPSSLRRLCSASKLSTHLFQTVAR